MATVHDEMCAVLADVQATLLADIKPTWQQNQQQHTASKAISTDPQQLQDADTQTTDRCDASVQASTSGCSISTSAAQRGRLDPSLTAFLNRVGPTMFAALAANVEDAGGVAGNRPAARFGNRQGNEGTAECLFTLAAFSSGYQPASNSNNSSNGRSVTGRMNQHKLQVTSLSWSKTGQTVAASFGRYDIEGWCCLPGAIATWNLARLGHQDSSSSRPDRLIDVDTCVMCCAFHPSEPALLAGGTYNGELVIWDLNQEDANAQVGKTDVLSELRHREPITAISWQFSDQEARRHGAAAASYRLYTLGADGRLLVWLWNQLGNPIYGYELRLAQPGRNPQACLGGSCMAFCPAATLHEEAGLLLVGTEGGQLLHCQVNNLNDAALQEFSNRLTAAANAGSTGCNSKVELRSAVHDSKYEPFSGPVNGLGSCPHHRQLAVAASGDGTLRVLDVLRSAPLLLLEPSAGALVTVAWSPSRPLVFAAGSADGRIHVYDLAARQRLVHPVAQLFEDASGDHGSGVNALVFNPRAPGMLAAAADDVVRVWQLPSRLVESRNGEAKLLRRLLDSEDVLGLLRAQCIVAA